MEYIKLEPKNGLGIKYTSNEDMHDIAFFLISDVGRHDCGFRDWLHDETMKEVEGNFFLLIKHDQDVLMNCKYNEDFYADASQFSIKSLVDLLEQWNMICKLSPDEITITYDQEKFHVEGKITTDSKEVVH